ncbi:MAG: AsmA-like C-terminal region-containing protein [Vicinamibacterales bacterium]
MKKRILLWAVFSSVAALVILTAIAVFALQPRRIRTFAEDGLSRHLNMVAKIDEISLSFYPRWRLAGQGLSLRFPNRPDLPPFISIERFSMNVGLFSLMRRHVETVHADGLKIAVPHGDVRQALTAGESSRRDSDVIIDHFVTHDATLTFVRRKPEDTPLEFLIHDLTVDAVGFGREMPFEATLTNPVPRGLVRTRGRVGPWLRSDGPMTPVSGAFTFSDADLSTINGIGGTLGSTGDFSGDLTAIKVVGQATVPNFSLDLGGKPVLLDCAYETIVDGTDGTTVLEHVDATLVQTKLSVTGAIRNLPGPGRHQVDLVVHVPDGNIEDLLALALDTPKPVMLGDISLHATLSLPPGRARVRDRLKLQGRFGLTSTRFTDTGVQDKLKELSRRSQGKKTDEELGRVLTNLRGRFKLGSGRMALDQLTFEVPGAQVALDGYYALANQEIDLRGTLRMKASVSKAVGGFKSFFLKPFDPLFRKDGAGAVIPIKITGTREAPKFGIEAGKIFKN